LCGSRPLTAACGQHSRSFAPRNCRTESGLDSGRHLGRHAGAGQGATYTCRMHIGQACPTRRWRATSEDGTSEGPKQPVDYRDYQHPRFSWPSRPAFGVDKGAPLQTLFRYDAKCRFRGPRSSQPAVGRKRACGEPRHRGTGFGRGEGASGCTASDRRVAQTASAARSRKLGVAHFAFMRGPVQGLPLRETWERYLGAEGRSTDLRVVRTTIRWIRDEFAAAARREEGHRRREGARVLQWVKDHEGTIGIPVGAHVALARAAL
jgi:hypothetical protein